MSSLIQPRTYGMHRLVMQARPEQQVLVQDRTAELFRTHRFLAQIIRIPVSYTHLDVYKRQVYEGVKANKARVLHLFIRRGVAQAKFSVPVSYTHLISRTRNRITVIRS